MDILKYVIEKALILIPVLYIIGAFLKNTPLLNNNDWLIPWILLVLGVMGGTAIVGITAEGVIQGVLVAGATVFCNQLIKQTANKD